MAGRLKNRKAKRQFKLLEIIAPRKGPMAKPRPPPNICRAMT